MSVVIIVQALRAIFPARRIFYILPPLKHNAEWNYVNGLLGRLPSELNPCTRNTENACFGVLAFRDFDYG